MHKPLSQCPICMGQLEPVKLKCVSCDLVLEGELPSSRLALLSPEQQQFVEEPIRFFFEKGSNGNWYLNMANEVALLPMPGAMA